MKAKSASGKGARVKPATIYSTSEARANFAEALEAARTESAVIGFDRYGQTVAALVPLEAIYLLAGKGDGIAPATRDAIESSARSLVQDILQPEAQLEREWGGGKSSFAKAGVKPSLAKAPKRKPGSKS